MARQADSRQTRTPEGRSPHDDYGETFGLRESDIRTPPAPGSSLDSLHPCSSDLQSSIGKSTSPTHMSDVVFGSDKASPFGDHSAYKTYDGTTLNPLHSGMLSTGFSGYEVPSIDPPSINPQFLRLDYGLGENTGLLPLSQPASISAAVNASSNTASGWPSQMIYPNDFNIALEETKTAPGVKNSDLSPLSYLVLWSWLKPGLLPSAKELKCLEDLAHIPAKENMTWLKKHMSGTSKRHVDALQGIEIRQYRAKCLNSRQRKIQSGEPRLFECTNRCGQTFSRYRKGDWERHERINFEEWVCSVCSDAFTRKEHLRNHLKVAHDIEGTKLESQKRQLLDSMDRPCGFCCKPFSTWVEWLAHVAAHFEGSINGRKRKMSDWKERMITAPSSGTSPKPSSGYHDVGGSDNNYDDDDDSRDGGGDGNNSGSNALNSSYLPSHGASGVGQGHAAHHSFGFPHASFNGNSRDTTSQTHANVQGAPSLRPTDEAKIALDDKIVHTFAALGISAIEVGSASDAYSKATSSAHPLTYGNVQPRARSLPGSVSESAITIPYHQRKRSIDGPQTKVSPTNWNEVKSAPMMSRWLHEKPHQEPWTSISRARVSRWRKGNSVQGDVARTCKFRSVGRKRTIQDIV